MTSDPPRRIPLSEWDYGFTSRFPARSGGSSTRRVRFGPPGGLPQTKGDAPSPEMNMISLLELTDSEKMNRSRRIDEYVADGSIHHKELDSLTGRLSYARTSRFGRFGGKRRTPYIGSYMRIFTIREFRARCRTTSNGWRILSGDPCQEQSPIAERNTKWRSTRMPPKRL